jgi:protein-tyrosine phosphatase
MAMGIFKSKMQANEGWRIESAGVWARQGYPVHTYVQMILNNRGVDLKDHRSRRITREILKHFNLVLVMELGHKEGLRVAFPEYTNKVFLLSEMVNHNFDIVDPIGGEFADFHETAIEIEQILDDGFGKIIQLASNHSRTKDD